MVSTEETGGHHGTSQAHSPAAQRRVQASGSGRVCAAGRIGGGGRAGPWPERQPGAQVA